jgi:serine/threonine protein kinase
MAPEQIRGGTIDQRVDVWSLGALLYEMLAGVPAYPLTISNEATFLAIATGKPKPLAQVAPHVPRALVAVVEGAMEHELDERIPDAKTFAARLEKTDARASLQRSVLEPEPRSGGWGTTLAIVVVVLALAGAGAWALFAK